jgi:hypothetical protein
MSWNAGSRDASIQVIDVQAWPVLHINNCLYKQMLIKAKVRYQHDYISART